RRELREYGWGPAEVDAYIAEVGMKDMTPRIPTERILFVAGEHDRFLHADRTHALWKRWGEPPIHWFPGGHLGIFTHVGETTAAMRRHLERIGLVAPAAALARA
ncbi:MAG: hypothetical protein K8I02_03930, partial [Candidatus Methylomirabilis sp.]|nr:hypothetical protein [Deltaproteobacteria bacterium]